MSYKLKTSSKFLNKNRFLFCLFYKKYTRFFPEINLSQYFDHSDGLSVPERYAGSFIIHMFNILV